MSITLSNPTAFSVYSNYTAASGKLTNSMTRLSTGVKRVADDGAGVGISERMRSQARSTAMARNNVENGISLLQTADGWMQQVNDLLSRMHELSVESYDATKTNTDRGNIESEFSQLKSEINRIVKGAGMAAKFNGMGLLNGSITGATQVGADSGQTIDISFDALSGITGSIGGVSTATTAGSSIGIIQGAINTVAQVRAKVGGIQSRLEHTRAGLLTYEDNIRAAESKIRDVDMAYETAELTRQQILGQVGNAMLAQANQLPAGIMQLLG
jgi:flagellin